MIILGSELDKPVDFVVCWTKGAKEVGGTAMGIKVAKKYSIPVFNIADPNRLQELRHLFVTLKERKDAQNANVVVDANS